MSKAICLKAALMSAAQIVTEHDWYIAKFSGVIKSPLYVKTVSLYVRYFLPISLKSRFSGIRCLTAGLMHNGELILLRLMTRTGER